MPAGRLADGRIRKGVRRAMVRRVQSPRPGRRWRYMDPGARWCVAWRTEAMPASAFWYYRTKAEALAVAASIRREVP